MKQNLEIFWAFLRTFCANYYKTIFVPTLRNVEKNFKLWGDLRNPGVSRENKFPVFGTMGFLTCFSIDSRKPHTKLPKTHLSAALGSWHSWKFLFFSIFSKLYFKKKKSFHFTVGFVTCFSVDTQNPNSKLPKTHLFTAFWSWHSWKFWKIKVFVFLNFLEILFQTYAWVPQIASQLFKKQKIKRKTRKLKNLWCRKCVRRAIFRNVEGLLTLFATRQTVSLCDLLGVILHQKWI